MRVLPGYKQISQLVQQEYFEPLIGWAFRVMIAILVPFVGFALIGKPQIGVWMSLTAECLSWIELKGSYANRTRVLVAGTVLSLLALVLGSLTGHHFILSIIGAGAVAFCCCLMKNLGDRASGLAVSLFVMYFIAADAPPDTAAKILERCTWVLYGCIWNYALAMAFVPFLPQERPFRRSIGIIWKNTGSFIFSVYNGLNGKSKKLTSRDWFARETEIRDSIESSIVLYDKLAHEFKDQQKHSEQYRLARFRQQSSLFAASVMNLMSLQDRLARNKKLGSLQTLSLTVASGFYQACQSMSLFVYTSREADRIMVQSRIARIRRLLQIYERSIAEVAIREMRSNNETLLDYYQHSMNLLEEAFAVIKDMEAPKAGIYEFSMVGFLRGLHPRTWWRGLVIVFNTDTYIFKFALRTTIAAMIGMGIYKWFDIDHGYWIPFTILIVLQPDFGSTWKKATHRMAGTVLGVLTGGLILLIPSHYSILEIMLFISTFFMIYFIRSNYTIAVYFITVTLMLMYKTTNEASWAIIGTRIACTMGGSALAIVAGYLFFPVWEKNRLPELMVEALNANLRYVHLIFRINASDEEKHNWLKLRRKAEAANSNAFNSMQRLMNEPGMLKILSNKYFALVANTVRLTREINRLALLWKDNPEVTINETYAAELSQTLEHMTGRFSAALLYFNALPQDQILEKLEKDTRTSGQQTGKLFNQADQSLHLKLSGQLEKIIFEYATINLIIEDIVQIKNNRHV